MRRSLIAVLAIFASVSQGCFSARSATPGLTAYSGIAVQERSIPLMSGASNRIDIAAAKRPRQIFEQVNVFVEPVVVEDLSRSEVAYTASELRPLLQTASEEAVAQFGRFARVKDRSRADVLMTTRLWSVVAWADTRLSEEEASSIFDASVSLSRAIRESVDREGVDVNVTVSFSYPDGTEFASTRALGQLIALNGEVLESGNVTFAPQLSGSHGARLKISNARIKPTELPRVMTAAVDGAIADALKLRVERQLWLEQVDASGMRVRRDSFGGFATAGEDG